MGSLHRGAIRRHAAGRRPTVQVASRLLLEPIKDQVGEFEQQLHPFAGQVRDRKASGYGQLVKQLTGEVSTLVHQEMELAKAEVTTKVKTIARYGDAGPGPKGSVMTAASVRKPRLIR